MKFSVRFLLCLFFLLTVMVSAVRICYGSSDTQESLEKSMALLFLEEISCIDMSAYNMTLNWELEPSSITDYFYPGHMRTFVTACLQKGDSKLEVEIEFIDGKFHSYYLFSPEHGDPIKKARTPIHPIELARLILQRYSLNFDAAYCYQFEKLLNKITTPDLKQEIEEADLFLEFVPAGESAFFVWRFKTNNGLVSKKSFSISIERGVLTALMDNWRFYKVGNVKVGVSEEEAINVALNILQTMPEGISEVQKEVVKTIQKQFKEEGAKIVDHEATLLFTERSGDCFTLDAAAWRITFTYDRTYSYHMTGFEVCIWADNGQIYDVGSQGYYESLDGAEAPNQSHLYIYALIALILAASIAPVALTIYKKYKHSRSMNQTEHFSKQTIA